MVNAHILRLARKEAKRGEGVGVCQTNIGTVDCFYHPTTRCYSFTSWKTGAQLVSGLTAKAADEYIVSLYQPQQ